MPQSYLAPHAITVGVDMRGEHDPAAGCEHRGNGFGGTDALRRNGDAIHRHDTKINRRRPEEASRRRRHETALTPRYGPDLAPTNARGRGLVPVTVSGPLTQRGFCCSRTL